MYGSKRIHDLLVQKGVVPIRVDITSDSPQTRASKRMLEVLGSSSIPFMTLHPPGAEWNRPWRFRDLVTRGEVAEVLERFPDATLPAR